MKNLKSVIVNSVLIGLGILFIGFMAGAYLPGIVTTSGYNMLSTCLKYFSKAYQYAAFGITTLLEIVCVALVVVFALLNLLIALGVIKNEKLTDKFNKALVVLTVLALVFVALSFIGFADFIKLADGCGYAMIINIIVLFAAAVVAIYNKVAAKKEAKPEQK